MTADAAYALARTIRCMTKQILWVQKERAAGRYDPTAAAREIATLADRRDAVAYRLGVLRRMEREL